MSKRVLDVGNCGPDHHSLTMMVTNNFDATVDQAHQAGDALSLLAENNYALVVVNRLLDCDRSPGMDVIKQVQEQHPDVPVMLVTNFDEHQKAAVAAGCKPGYGKNDLFSPASIELFSCYLK